MEALRLVVLCLVLGTVVGMFSAHLFGFLFWIALALVLVWAGVRLWPRMRAMLNRMPEDARPRS